MEPKKTNSGREADRQPGQAANEDHVHASTDDPQNREPEFDSAQPHDTDVNTELAEARGRALRAQAELENYRKRIRRDMDEERRYATLPLIRDLLPVIDNLDRALTAVEVDGAASGLHEGVQMVVQQLQTVLEQHNCRAIDAIGLSFDPMCHEAIAEQPSDQPPGTVIEVAQVGYRIHDRVIRPTQVIVSKGPDNAAAGND